MSIFLVWALQLAIEKHKTIKQKRADCFKVTINFVIAVIIYGLKSTVIGGFEAKILKNSVKSVSLLLRLTFLTYV